MLWATLTHAAVMIQGMEARPGAQAISRIRSAV